jgi:hypothetical protein
MKGGFRTNEKRLLLETECQRIAPTVLPRKRNAQLGAFPMGQRLARIQLALSVPANIMSLLFSFFGVMLGVKTHAGIGED